MGSRKKNGVRVSEPVSRLVSASASVWVSAIVFMLEPVKAAATGLATGSAAAFALLRVSRGKLVGWFRDRCKYLMHAASLMLGAVVLVMASGCTVNGDDRQVSPAESRATYRLNARADLAYRQGRWPEAARLYGQLTHIIPDDPYAWFRLANSYLQQEDFYRAAHAYETSLAHSAAQPKAWLNLSTVYLLRAESALRAVRPQLVEDPLALRDLDVQLALINELLYRPQRGNPPSGSRAGGVLETSRDTRRALGGNGG